MFSCKAVLTLGLLSLASLIAPVSAVYKVTKRDAPQAWINLRVEGATSTLFEGNLWVGYGNVTTPSGGNHQCNGLNGGAHNQRGPTPTYALHEAAGGRFDGTWDSSFQDFFITRIGNDAETANEFWGLLVNFQFSSVGGCQQVLQNGQYVLWAYNAFNQQHFLRLDGPTSARRGAPTTFRVTDGATGQPIVGASIGPFRSGPGGYVNVEFPQDGQQTVKATLPGSLRSNGIAVTVYW